MTDNKFPQMPVCGHDQSAYIRDMYEWHQEMSLRTGVDGVHHSERAKSFLEMMENAVDSVDSTFF